MTNISNEAKILVLEEQIKVLMQFTQDRIVDKTNLNELAYLLEPDAFSSPHSTKNEARFSILNQLQTVHQSNEVGTVLSKIIQKHQEK